MKRVFALLLAALLGACLIAPAAEAAGPPFGIESVGGALVTPAGEPNLQAGAHANFETSFSLNVQTNSQGEKFAINPKDVSATLPAGLIGDPTATPTCSQEEFYALELVANCDPSSQVGVAVVSFYSFGEEATVPEPIYNLDPPPGVAAQFAFNTLSVPTYIDATVTADGEYRLRATAAEISQAINIGGTDITLWGVPASHAYDAVRSPRGFEFPGEPIESTAPERPFIGNPTSCPGTPLRTDYRADSWRAPGAYSEKSTETDAEGRPLAVTGCDRVPFEASFSARPTTTRAESPTGLQVELDVPQNRLPGGLRSSDLREAAVEFPEGMTLSPAAAGGLGSCSEDQIGLGSDSPPNCPANSRVGSIELTTPLLSEPLGGSVYLAQQGRNRFGSLLALYLVIENPARGVLVKITGRVDPDPTSGRLVAHFDGLPQLPISKLALSFTDGPRAPLMTPSACGTYPVEGLFSPWSGGATVRTVDTFKVESGPDGGACPAGAFAPSLGAGTASAAAGSYSPLELRISRADGTQRLGGVSVQLPHGLLARLAGVGRCSDQVLAAIPAGPGTGAGELASPACPAGSRVGSVAVAAGPGPSPFWAKTGSAYLAGPYRGAPFSLAIVVPALAGPFDLGNVVVRVALAVDPVTTQVTATSDPLPTILDGIPLDLRDLRVTLDRPGFTLNATACEKQRFAATIVSTGGATANPTAPYAATSCGGLGFGPRLALALRGGTTRGAFPALTATLRAKPGQANLGRVSVALPRSEFLAQQHIRTVCTRVQFAAGACPAASVYGTAEVRTPLLDQPLAGPVYLRSSSHQLPDLVIALRGELSIDLDGRIDSKHGGIRTTFTGIPDAPITSFALRLGGGRKSLLVNSTNICKGTHRATVAMIGQNAKRARTEPNVQARCTKR